MYTLVLQSFGREYEYKRAVLTILSYYAHSSLSPSSVKVLLFTDKPGYFDVYLKGLSVEYVLLTPEKIKRMRGSIDFLHRMKIALIEEAFGKIEGNMLYTDSDTFFIADPTPVVQQVKEDVSFMHLCEYEFGKLRELSSWAGKTFSAFCDLIETKTFDLPEERKLKVTPEHASWNAGVMFFHPSHAKLIPDVYALTDQFFPLTQNHASEQYAFSVVLLEHTELRACDNVIYHYWYNIKKQVIDQFLGEKLNKTWGSQSLERKLGEVKSWTKMLPGHLEKHVLMMKDNAIQAFNKNNFSEGYKWTLKALLRSPFQDGRFYKDVLYHTKRRVLSKS